MNLNRLHTYGDLTEVRPVLLGLELAAYVSN